MSNTSSVLSYKVAGLTQCSQNFKANLLQLLQSLVVIESMTEFTRTGISNFVRRQTVD